MSCRRRHFLFYFFTSFFSSFFPSFFPFSFPPFFPLLFVFSSLNWLGGKIRLYFTYPLDFLKHVWWMNISIYQGEYRVEKTIEHRQEHKFTQTTTGSPFILIDYRAELLLFPPPLPPLFILGIFLLDCILFTSRKTAFLISCLNLNITSLPLGTMIVLVLLMHFFLIVPYCGKLI